MIDHLTRSELFRKLIAARDALDSLPVPTEGRHTWPPVIGPAAFPLMTHPQPDTAERTRLAVQSIPFALPEKRCGRCEKCAPVLKGLSAAEQMIKLEAAMRAMENCPLEKRDGVCISNISNPGLNGDMSGPKGAPTEENNG